MGKRGKNALLEKATDGLFQFKAYWRKPPKGYQVSYKEFAAFAVGCGGQSFLSILVQYTTLATSVHLMISYFKMSTGMAWFLGVVAAAVTIIRSPILSMIIDNSNGKKGKFKPFLMWSAVGSIVCFGVIPYIPKAWTEMGLFSIPLPAIPIMGVHEASTLDFNLAILLAFLFVQAGLFFYTLLNQCIGGIEQTISSVAQERANISALRGLVSNIPGSVINVFLPILAGSLFASRGGWNAVEMYRLIFPVCAVGSLFLVSLIVKGVEERVVVNQGYVAKVRFWEGVKLLSRNKYFWILNIYNAATMVRNLSNITTWITQYSFVSDTAKTWVGLYCTTLLMNAVAVALLIGPFMVRKFGKRKVALATNFGYVGMILLQLVFYKHPVLILTVSFFQQLCGGFYFIPGIMTSDVLDSIQLQTGKRLEGFWQNYSEMIKTVLTVFTGMLTPLFLSLGGIGFSDNLSIVLQNESLRNGAFFYQSLLALLGSVIAAVPFLFYDLTEHKHANIVRVLKIRAAVKNYQDHTLQDKDVLNVQEILNFSAETPEEAVSRELARYDCIDGIVADYDAVRARAQSAEQKELAEEFARNVELETRRMEARLTAARKKAQKKGGPFDEAAFREAFIAQSRFLKDAQAQPEPVSR